MYKILFFFLQKKLNRGEKIEFKTVGSEESESNKEGKSEEEEEEEEEREKGEEREMIEEGERREGEREDDDIDELSYDNIFEE